MDIALIPEKHRALAATWQPGQKWETRIVETPQGVIENPVWVPLYEEPLWDRYQEYRLANS